MPKFRVKQWINAGTYGMLDPGKVYDSATFTSAFYNGLVAAKLITETVSNQSTIKPAQAVTTAATTLVVTGLVEPDANYVVLVDTNWVTSYSITGKTATGFTVTFGTAAPASAVASWVLVR